MSKKDEKINSLVDNGVFEDEANMDIIRCGISPFKIVALMFIFLWKRHVKIINHLFSTMRMWSKLPDVYG